MWYLDIRARESSLKPVDDYEVDRAGWRSLVTFTLLVPLGGTVVKRLRAVRTRGPWWPIRLKLWALFIVEERMSS